MSKGAVPKSTGTVEREDRGRVAILRLRRDGKANAWGPDMAAALVDRLADVAADGAIGSCIITGTGTRAFSSGADISAPGAHQAPSAGSVLASGVSGRHPVFDALDAFQKPLIASINGLAIGAGVLIMLYCDVVLASDSAQFSMPQVALGVLPAFGSIYRLATWVGRGRANEIVLSGRRVPADEAREIGLVHRVFAQGELLEGSMEVAGAMASLPPLAAAAAKESLRVAYELSGQTTTARFDQYRFGMLGLTEDCQEAHAAWRERRPPIYKGE